MTLSIIVPIYKIEKFLPECIDSILKQTYKDFELILVNDGSPDKCHEICDMYAKKDDRIKVIHKKNGGLVSARKSGLEIATGQYIGYVDGDDWIEPDFFEKLMSCAMDNNADIVASGFVKDIGNNRIQKINTLKGGYYSREKIKSCVIPRMMFDMDSFEPGLFTYVWNKIFKKDILYNAQMRVPNEISLGEDAACVYPAVLKAGSLHITNDCLYHYRQRADSMLKISESYKVDCKCYNLLYSYLFDCFNLHTDSDILIDKLELLILYLLTIRCGGLLEREDKVEFYLYENSPIDKRIAVYGAGTLGQHLVNRIKLHSKFEVVKWVDPDYLILRDHNLPVDSFESLTEINFDSVLVAILDKKQATKVKKSIVEMGIQEEKIFISNFLNVNRKRILHNFRVI